MAPSMGRVPREVLAAGLGAVCVDGLFNPLAVVMARSQLEPGASPAQIARRSLGAAGLLRGLVLPGLLPMCLKGLCSSGCRVGLYPAIRDRMPGDGLLARACAGATSGVIGVTVFSPFEMVRVRMVSGSPYPSTAAAFVAVAREAGSPAGLWRGVGPHAACSSLFSGVQLASYDSAKRLLRRSRGAEEGPALHMAASFLSGLCAQVASHPAATVKTVLMDRRAASGRGAGAVGTLLELLSQGGVGRLYPGLLPALAFKAPAAMVYMPVVEQFRARVFCVGYL
ncbi:unnamed protein product [Prorocentrum cordatum]|uniref:Uncharacterized protein n=1 Tax=Prorocentrum cordatum TaxID=2364126 RepID=A0ABN9Q8B6_9DINO|nr:unnamed protein product [Polarella glacialis]